MGKHKEHKCQWRTLRRWIRELRYGAYLVELGCTCVAVLRPLHELSRSSQQDMWYYSMVGAEPIQAQKII